MVIVDGLLINRDRTGFFMKKPLIRNIFFKTAIAAITLLLAMSLTFKPAQAQPLSESRAVAQEQGLVTIYFFWGNGCPHCAEAIPYFRSLLDEYPRLRVQSFEVWYNEKNAETLMQVSEGYGFEPQYVPTIFIGEKYWQGFSEAIASEIRSTVEGYMTSGDPNMAANFLNGAVGTDLPVSEDAATPVVTVETQAPTATVTPQITSQPTPTAISEAQTTEVPASQKEIEIPLFGKIDLSHQSALVSTLLIALVDGFNPCSIWVLSMLLSITLHSGSRKKVLLIGFIFLTVTALIYALFISGLFTFFKVVKFMGWIRVLVALVALFFALVNIKDYFWYKEGISFTIDDKNKPGIYKRIRALMDAGDSFGGLVGGTIVLAAGVSLVEFACTAGFPVLWTNLLNAQNVPTLTFVLLLILYMLIYQMDELAIFLVAVFSLKANKVEEKHGRILKLIGGVLMFALAIVMLVKPAIMSDLGESMIVFGAAFAATLLILLLHRVVLPRMGIRIGTELSPKTKKRR